MIALILMVAALLPADVPGVLAERLVWLPMTGATDKQMADAAGAGYEAVLWKVSVRVKAGTEEIDFAGIDKQVVRARRHGLKSILAIIGEGSLGSAFFDVDEEGRRLNGHLDPFWSEAMARIEWGFSKVIERYAGHPDVAAFAPTWGIYGEAGFKSFSAGRSPHALARFNEWRQARGLASLDVIPTRRDGPNTEYNRFIRFRYCYMEDQWDAMFSRLKARSGCKPVGTWQELYPVIGYLYHMVDVPSADFALYESCFPFQTSHHSEKTLAETMGFRYRCDSAEGYRDYYLPLLARKRGEGQRFMGCQLSNSYADKNYRWPTGKAERVRFDQWEDDFAPYLRKLHAVAVEPLARDVLFVFPNYAAAALSELPVHSVDTMTLDVLFRMYGCPMRRCGSQALDQLTVEEMDAFRLIVVPCSAYLPRETFEKLSACKATVLFTGCFGQALDGVYVPFGGERAFGGMRLRYVRRPAGEMRIEAEDVLTRGCDAMAVSLPEDEAFDYADIPSNCRVWLRCGGLPLLSTMKNGRFLFVHGHLFAGLAHDPERKPSSNSGGSADASANEVDLWGPYSSVKQENLIGRVLVRNILDHAGVRYRVVDPKPRTATRYLGDHMEQASVSANIAYNNTGVPQRIRVRLPYSLKGWHSVRVGDGFEAEVTVPPFGYVVLEAEEPTG